PTNVWLGNLGHRDGGLNPRMQTDALHGRLQGQRVDYRSQHAHIVGGGAVHAARGSRLATPEIAAADDHAHLHPAPGHRRPLPGRTTAATGGAMVSTVVGSMPKAAEPCMASPLSLSRMRRKRSWPFEVPSWPVLTRLRARSGQYGG